MNRLFVPTRGPEDWRRLLADPDSQWKPRKSALEMAVCWESARESARGLPPEVAATVDSCPGFAGAELVIGIPEHRVSFGGGGHASQNDLWALLRVRSEFLSLSVEAKAGEKLGDLVREWSPKDRERSRKAERLSDLQRWLGVSGHDVGHIRYQLLHRAASALKEAERFGAQWAALLVHSFNRAADQASWEDFERFGALLGAAIEEGRLTRADTVTTVPLFLGWVSSAFAGEDRLRGAI